jgi:hypothetical protein
METTFKTNGRLLSQIFSSYNTTFDALCELINNSIQASASEIRIEIDLVSDDDAGPYPCTEYRVIDNGIGISSSDFEQKILEIATDVKFGGKGIGRFSAFQIGAAVSIETTAFDNQLNKYTKTTLTLNAKSLSVKDLSSYKFDISTTILEKKKLNTYYKLIIKDFWNEVEKENNPKKTFISKLLPGKLEEALFLKYSTLIITDKIDFFVNDKKLKKDDFLVDEPENYNFDFEFSDNSASNISLEYIHYKGKNKNMILSYRIDNSGIKLSGFEDLIGLDYPDDNAWLVHIGSEIFTSKSDIFRNLPFDGMDGDLSKLKNEVRSIVRDFMKEKHREYFAFKQTLVNDNYYPYRNGSPSGSKEIAFNQIAFFIERDYSILQKKETIRQVIYPLLDKAISNGDIEDILKCITSLDNEQVKKFKELLENAALSDVIRFSNDVYKKQQFLDFLNEIVYGEISKYLLERRQLQKIIAKNLWIFGEEYTNTPILFSDTQLAKNLDALRMKHFKFIKNKDSDDANYYDVKEKEILDITDLFFYNEKIMDNNQREVMIVELKAPRVKISQTELNQVERYMVDIEQLDKFSKEVKYKIILVSSGYSKIGESLITQEDDKPYYRKSNKPGKDIEIRVLKWSDIISRNKQRLSYLGNQLQTCDINVKDIFKKNYPELNIDNLEVTAKKTKKRETEYVN